MDRRTLWDLCGRHRNNVGFWILGFLNNFGYVVMLSAAEDIYAGGAGAVLAADIVPTFLVTATGPFWVHHLSYRSRVWAVGVIGVASFLMVGAGTPEYTRPAMSNFDLWHGQK